MATVKERVHYKYDRPAAVNHWDVLAALACLIFFAPLILSIYLLVRADGGPAFVSHAYVGSEGASFTAWKFRTARLDSERRGRDEGSVSTNPSFTVIGGFLYRTRSDMLPRFYNVVKGDLTLFEMMDDT